MARSTVKHRRWKARPLSILVVLGAIACSFPAGCRAFVLATLQGKLRLTHEPVRRSHGVQRRIGAMAAGPASRSSGREVEENELRQLTWVEVGDRINREVAEVRRIAPYLLLTLFVRAWDDYNVVAVGVLSVKVLGHISIRTANVYRAAWLVRTRWLSEPVLTAEVRMRVQNIHVRSSPALRPFAVAVFRCRRQCQTGAAAVVVPVGATEQHGPNGLIGTDHMTAEVSQRGGR